MVAVYNAVSSATGDALSLFPNPSTGADFSIKTAGITEPLVVSIYNQFGKKLYEHQYQLNGEEALQVAIEETLPTGMYVVRMLQGQSLTVKKLKVSQQ